MFLAAEISLTSTHLLTSTLTFNDLLLLPESVKFKTKNVVLMCCRLVADPLVVDPEEWPINSFGSSFISVVLVPLWRLISHTL